MNTNFHNLHYLGKVLSFLYIFYRLYGSFLIVVIIRKELYIFFSSENAAFENNNRVKIVLNVKDAVLLTKKKR